MYVASNKVLEFLLALAENTNNPMEDVTIMDSRVNEIKTSINVNPLSEENLVFKRATMIEFTFLNNNKKLNIYRAFPSDTT